MLVHGPRAPAQHTTAGPALRLLSFSFFSLFLPDSVPEIKDIVPPWPELVRLINDVRSDIPDIPEIKYYDKELEALAEQISQVKSDIPEIPEVKYYDGEIEAICEQIDSVKEKVLELPEVKYYDEQIKDLDPSPNLPLS